MPKVRSIPSARADPSTLPTARSTSSTAALSSPPTSASTNPSIITSSTTPGTSASPLSPPLPIYTRLGIPTRRRPPASRHTPSLTKRVILYDCQTPGHGVHIYVFETHLNGSPIPIDPTEDGALVARVRTPKCPLPARQSVVRQVQRLNGPPALFGGPAEEEEGEMDEEDDEMEHITARISTAEASLSTVESRLKWAPSFALKSEAFWATSKLTALRARRTALLARRVHADLLSSLDSARTPKAAARLLRRALQTPVTSHADRRVADYAVVLIVAHIAVLTLEGAARRATLIGLEAVKEEVKPFALLRLALAAVLGEHRFWDPERRESQVTLRRWLERWAGQVGEDEDVEVGPLLDSLGVH